MKVFDCMWCGDYIEADEDDPHTLRCPKCGWDNSGFTSPHQEVQLLFDKAVLNFKEGLAGLTKSDAVPREKFRTLTTRVLHLQSLVRKIATIHDFINSAGGDFDDPSVYKDSSTTDGSSTSGG